MTYLLDTNVISELRKLRPDPNVATWWAAVSSAEVFISSLTIGEIRIGIERLRHKDPDRADRLDEWLTGLRASYADHIVGIDPRIADEWGRLSAARSVPVVDGLLAATAQSRGWTLVTRNVADVRGCGVPVLNPFDRGDGTR